MNKIKLIEKLMTKTKQPVTRADMERIVVGFMDEVKAAVAAGTLCSLLALGLSKLVNGPRGRLVILRLEQLCRVPRRRLLPLSLARLLRKL